MRRIAIGGLVVAWASCALAFPVEAAAQGERYAIVVQGTSGGEPYATQYRQWLDGLVGTLRGKFGLDAAHLAVLAEQPRAGEINATAENVRATIDRFVKQVKEPDLVVILLIGHGGGEGADAKFNLVGPDLSVGEWAALIKPLSGKLAFVNATGSSFPFLKGLAAPGRVVITATSSPGQRYDTVFAGSFIQSLTADAADADKNARVSLLEAFLHASRLVKQHYEQAGTMATEKPVFDDTGEGVGREAAVPGGSIGTIAGLTYLDAPSAPKSTDPELQQLLDRQQTLTQQVDDLRRKRPSMPAAEYDTAFEKLITELALVSRDVRRRGIK